MGRQREFDIEVALKKATRLFWKKGYDGASMSDLLKTLNISAPSFYFAFGSKESLFEKVVDAYHLRLAAIVEASLRRNSVAEIVEELLSGCGEIFIKGGDVRGCLILNSSLPVHAGDRLKMKFARQREEFRLAIQHRIQELGTGKRARGITAEALSRLIVSWLWGLAIEAQLATGPKQIRKTITAAVRIIHAMENVGS